MKSRIIHSSSSQAKFEQLYTQEHKMLFNYAYQHLKDRDLAKDHVQECFIRLWKHWPNMKENHDPRSYLYSISKNLVFDEFKKKAQFHGFSKQQQNQQTESCNDNEERQSYQELNQIYQEAIATLPEKRQQIFRLSKQNQLSNLEIATELDISVNTVRDQLVKGNKQVKSYISKKINFVSKTFFLLLIVFLSSLSVYPNKAQNLAIWIIQDFKIYITNI